MTTVPIRTPSAFRSETWAPHQAIIILCFVLVATSVFFFLFPGVDLAVSRWFHDPSDGFILANDPILRLLRSSSTWVLVAAVLLALAQLTRRLVAGGPMPSGAQRPLWLLTSLVVGPGLLVNGVLKDHWGRPRPVQTDLFGGDAPFQKVWVVGSWCDRNCSFVSGEASSAAWLVAAALITPPRIRPIATAIATTYALALSVNRIAFGGHFVSDVLLAWLLCALVFAYLWRLLVTPGYQDRPLALRSRSGAERRS